MASFLTHGFVFIFYFLFPDKFDLLALLIGAYIIDFESVLKLPYNYFIKKFSLKESIHFSIGIFHSIIGSLGICLPLTILIVYSINPLLGIKFSILKVFYSSIIGIFSHLALDLPGHEYISLLWPFKKFNKNPFLLFKNFKKLYPFNIYKTFEKYPYQYLPEFNWMVFSHILLIISIVIYFIII
ncbi:metal-dependent hydrolase [Candidatus Woesearchaeota archaeon]|nr:metal-dependent hydrolase [Candidatus Woesearchaeota archaeon]